MKDYTVIEDATFDFKGQTVLAKDILLENSEPALQALGAAKELTKNFFVRMIVSLVINLIKDLISHLFPEK